jgi:hypothetical protein
VGSYTTRTGKLWKPVAGDTVNVTTDINNNMDNLDTYAMGFAQITNAAARPTTVWPGLCVFQTADQSTWVSNGTAPASASWIQIPNAATSTAVVLSLAATTTDALTSKITTDTTNRYVLNADGAMEWGPGAAAATDTNLYRSAQDTLKTDDSIVAVRNMGVGGNLSVGGGVGVLGLLNATTAPTANPTGGNILYSSGAQLTARDQNGLITRINGAVGLSPTAASHATFTTERVIATFTLPANDPVTGATYRMRVWGIGGLLNTSEFVFRTRINGLTGVQLATATVNNGTGSTTTSRPWVMDCYMACIGGGASATFFGQHMYMGHVNTSGALTSTTPAIRHDGASISTAVDSTTATDWVLTASCNTSSASNTLTVRGVMCERVA